MRLTKIAPIAGLAVLSAGMLTACGGSSDNSSKPAAGGESGASCPLVKADRPGQLRGRRRACRPPPTRRRSPRSRTYNVAFSQNASNNPWRLAETASMKERGGQAGHPAHRHRRQQPAVEADRGHQGADRPEAGRALHRADHRAARATSSRTPPRPNIPVFLLDRDVDHAVAKPGQDFVTVIQSDFVQEGKRAAVQMAKATGGNAKIIELEGTTGASPAIDRKKGFDEAIKQCPGMQVVVSQDARLHPRQGPVGRRDPAAVAPGRHRHLRPQRRDGPRRDRGHQGDRQGARQGHQGRLDRRREGRPQGGRRRRPLRDGGVQPALRPQRLPDHDGATRPARRPRR